jgi:DNA-binding PadR family transcriptional regulator
MAEEGRDPEFFFGEKDAGVLRVIGEEDLTGFTFDGLKRRLGMHPETLSRILYRLEGEGIIERGSSGYEVTEKGKDFLRLYPLSTNGSCLPLLQTLLFPDLPIQQIVSDLKGKWFGVLRWLGYSKNDEDVTLKWITEDGGVQVDAKFSGGELSIEAKQLQDKDLNSALKASYQLIGYISKLYSKRRHAKRVAYFRAKSSLSV